MPDNGGFATAAYIIVAVVYVSYAITLRVRMRGVRERARQLSSRSSESR